MMDQLSTLGMQINLVPKNAVTVTAGNDDDLNASVMFSGYILSGLCGRQRAAGRFIPHLCAHRPCRKVGHSGRARPAIADRPTSLRSCRAWQLSMGLKFENSGVNT
jgi:hypothetical protein